ncbi:MAG: hypothetical protein U0794_16930 [Isosphaeraceae bacterium]
MTWQCGGLEVMNAVEVLEISSTGALVRSSKLPHTRQRVWIRVEDPFRTEWYEAEVVRIQDGDQVALLFPQSCPFDLYKATRGVKSIERGPEYSSPEFNSRDWH